jgi:hypothetical protein
VADVVAVRRHVLGPSSLLPIRDGRPSLGDESTELGGLRFWLEMAMEGVDERAPDVGEGDPILRSARTRHRGFDGRQIEIQRLREGRRLIGIGPEQPLRLRVSLDAIDQRSSAREPEVLERPVVDREVGGRGPVLGTHVRQRRSIGDGEGGEAGPVELDEPAHHAVGAEHLGQRQDEVGRRRARGELARHLHADHIGMWEERGLTEHRRLGLDPADAPAQDPEPVDHRGVGIRAHQRVGEGDAVPDADDLAEVLQVHLVADTGAGRDDAESLEGLLGPSEQRVALTVAPVLPLDVGLVRLRGAEEVHLDRVIDDEVDRHERIDRRRIPAGSGDRAPHRGQIDDRRDPREILHQDPARHERHVRRRLRPPCERAHVLVRDIPGTGPSEEVLDEDTDREREAADVGDARLREPGKRVDVEGSVGGVQPRPGAGEFRSHPMGPLVVVSSILPRRWRNPDGRPSSRR